MKLDKYPCGILIDGSHISADDLNTVVISWCEDALDMERSERANLDSQEYDGLARSEALYWTCEELVSRVNDSSKNRYLFIDESCLFLSCYDKACTVCENTDE